VDSWQNPRITEMVKKIVEEKFKDENVRVKSVLLRPAGAQAQAEVHLEIDGSKRLADVELLLVKIEMAIRSQIPVIGRISSIPHSYPPQRTEPTRRFGIFGDRKSASDAA
jgi:divalent metal cation (Fe/Co/Zn/Cd) transporter